MLLKLAETEHWIGIFPLVRLLFLLLQQHVRNNLNYPAHTGRAPVPPLESGFFFFVIRAAPSWSTFQTCNSPRPQSLVPRPRVRSRALSTAHRPASSIRPCRRDPFVSSVPPGVPEQEDSFLPRRQRHGHIPSASPPRSTSVQRVASTSPSLRHLCLGRRPRGKQWQETPHLDEAHARGQPNRSHITLPQRRACLVALNATQDHSTKQRHPRNPPLASPTNPQTSRSRALTTSPHAAGALVPKNKTTHATEPLPTAKQWRWQATRTTFKKMTRPFVVYVALTTTQARRLWKKTRNMAQKIQLTWSQYYRPRLTTTWRASLSSATSAKFGNTVLVSAL